MALPVMTITAKVKSLSVISKGKAGPDYNVEFSVSSGLLKWFKSHHSLCDMKASGEPERADVKAAQEFLETLDKPIVEENYMPEQTVSVGETSPSWK